MEIPKTRYLTSISVWDESTVLLKNATTQLNDVQLNLGTHSSVKSCTIEPTCSGFAKTGFLCQTFDCDDMVDGRVLTMSFPNLDNISRVLANLKVAVQVISERDPHCAAVSS